VYFHWAGAPEDGAFPPNEFKDFVQDSLYEYANDDANDAEGVSEPKARCSRIHFPGDFHIDVPAYHLDAPGDARSLATMDGLWEDSDPKAIYVWWKDCFDEGLRHRARRLVRYLKMWVSLKFDDDSRPSSILLTVLIADSLLALDTGELNGDDEFFRATVCEIIGQLQLSPVVLNPVNGDENLNRLSANGTRRFIEALEVLLSTADRALAAPSKLDSADIWTEVFDHFFPMPTHEEIIEGTIGKALMPIRFDPEVLVHVSSKKLKYDRINSTGSIPKGSELTFELINGQALPDGAVVSWMVRNTGEEAEAENDLGHRRQSGLIVNEHAAYKGEHYMDVTVKLNGRIIGCRRIPVKITGLGIPLRNSKRPGWTKFRK
jgi:hypothetical protein